jgi:AcrR family transcriptional regulator
VVQVKKAEVEQAITQAAYELFMEHGYSGTRIPQIAKRAGVSPANIYVYFGSKLDILTSIYERWFAERLDELRLSLKTCVTPQERLKKIFLSMWLDFPAADNGFCNNLIEALSAKGTKEKYSSNLRVSVEQSLSKMLASCLPGLKRAQHKAISTFLLMAFDGYALNYHLHDGKLASAEEIDFLCRMIFACEENPGR